jgi:hypothetical protein
VSAMPVTFAADYVAERSRLTTFFRLILFIPLYIVQLFWALAAIVAVVIAWFAIVFSGRWPHGLYNFVAAFMRYSARVTGYMWLLSDPYPPFDGAEHPEYPVRLQIGAPKEHYSRLRTLLRIFLVIPIVIVAYVLQIVGEIVGVLSWLVIVILGRQVEGLHSVLRFTTSFVVRAQVYGALLSEDWPSFDDQPAVGVAPPAGTITDTSLAAPEAPAQQQGPEL